MKLSWFRQVVGASIALVHRIGVRMNPRHCMSKEDFVEHARTEGCTEVEVRYVVDLLTDNGVTTGAFPLWRRYWLELRAVNWEGRNLLHTYALRSEDLFGEHVRDRDWVNAQQEGDLRVAAAVVLSLQEALPTCKVTLFDEVVYLQQIDEALLQSLVVTRH